MLVVISLIFVADKKIIFGYNFEAPLAFYFFYTAQKMKFSIKDFFSKYDQTLRKLRICSHLLKKSLIENFSFCVGLLYVTGAF